MLEYELFPSTWFAENFKYLITHAFLKRQLLVYGIARMLLNSQHR